MPRPDLRRSLPARYRPHAGVFASFRRGAAISFIHLPTLALKVRGQPRAEATFGRLVRHVSYLVRHVSYLAAAI